jgi:hypothetical protein
MRPISTSSRVSNLLLVLSAVLSLLSACAREPEPSPDYFSWTNPVTDVVVHMPEGWRQSPETANKGETTIGYFTPNFASMMGNYGKVTLHYEDMREISGPMTLQKFVGNFIGYMRSQADHLSEPVFELHNGIPHARLSVEISHKNRQLLLRARFWTQNGLDYWYAIAESPIEDGDFAEMAAPLIEELQASTLATD